MLDRHVDPGLRVRGMTGLHWAAVGGQLGPIRLLVERGTPLEAKNGYGYGARPGGLGRCEQ
ncbi:hypothetical protein DVH26_19240 [Paenibacillus sp. H1-7]|uniref:ankyrin repeat domain-containing protein n=1 Tax=Paenibacillus sp. H1-7 TaxID=2282849 RepID=UPI001EF9180E|nr:ankyrin repeat domain-containing protein [Paenibacillus sp. H1-7]ULL16392.1 hypothetical protein DVH26_19240 [Paenibacillus sp. H1-7]